MIDFVDWIARRCGGTGSQATGDETEAQTVLAVAQTISVIISLAERSDDQNVVTLSTLHAAKGLEWQHVVLAGINEGLLPFRGKDSPKEGAEGEAAEDVAVTAQRLEEERRLMYVGITRARATLVVSTLARRKRGRETVAGMPSRFIAEMKLHETQSAGRPAREAEGPARRGGGAGASERGGGFERGQVGSVTGRPGALTCP